MCLCCHCLFCTQLCIVCVCWDMSLCCACTPSSCVVCEQWTLSGWTVVDSVGLTHTRILSKCAGIGCPGRSEQWCWPTTELVKQVQVVASGSVRCWNPTQIVTSIMYYFFLLPWWHPTQCTMQGQLSMLELQRAIMPNHAQLIEVPGVNMFITEVEVCMYDNTGTPSYT